MASNFNEIVNDVLFNQFVNNYNKYINIEDFERINSTTISWMCPDKNRGYTKPNIFITLKLDENKNPIFRMEIKLSPMFSYFSEESDNPLELITELNRMIDIVNLTRKQIDDIWGQWGLQLTFVA